MKKINFTLHKPGKVFPKLLTLKNFNMKAFFVTLAAVVVGVILANQISKMLKL